MVALNLQGNRNGSNQNRESECSDWTKVVLTCIPGGIKVTGY